MNSIKNIKNLFLLAIVGTTLVISSCKKDDPVPDPIPTPDPTVAGYVTKDTSFSILLAAVKKAGLDGTLNDASKTWTVFAPTNAAFRALGYSVASVEAITTPTDIAALSAILTYHVLSTKVTSTGVPVSDAVTTVNTRKLFASNNANGVFVNGVKVAVANVPVSNGVIHVIGKVLIPPTKTIAEIVSTNANFSLLLAAVQRANLASALSGPGKFTVFAPTDAAFIAAGAPYNTATNIGNAPVATVTGVVSSHAFTTNIFASDLVAGPTPATLNPLTTLTVALSSPPSVKITGSASAVSPISQVDIVATNGVIHVIDKVLL
jgi:uncharacterized surface protein with fasciclin (FAS1) repeats